MNSQSFTPEEIKKGLLQDLLNYLLDHNQKNNKSYYDIHITTDGYCTTVEWVDVTYEVKDPEPKFVLLGSDQMVMTELYFPDNHYEMVFPEEAEERLAEWHKEHPEWVKTPYGTWTNKSTSVYLGDMSAPKLNDELLKQELNLSEQSIKDFNRHSTLISDKDKEIYEENGIPQK